MDEEIVIPENMSPEVAEIATGLAPVEIALYFRDAEVSNRQIFTALRVLETLFVFRALSKELNSSGWIPLATKAEFNKYVTEEALEKHRARLSYFQMPAPLPLDDSFGTHVDWLEDWIAEGLQPAVAVRDGIVATEQFERPKIDVLPLLSIDKGSYEFIFSAVNLAAIFGFQDLSVVKDIVQWTCGCIQQFLTKPQPRALSTVSTKIMSNGCSLRLTPEILRALQGFDSAELTEERTSEKVKIVIRLGRKK